MHLLGPARSRARSGSGRARRRLDRPRGRAKAQGARRTARLHDMRRGRSSGRTRTELTRRSARVGEDKSQAGVDQSARPTETATSSSATPRPTIAERHELTEDETDVLRRRHRTAVRHLMELAPWRIVLDARDRAASLIRSATARAGRRQWSDCRRPRQQWRRPVRPSPGPRAAGSYRSSVETRYFDVGSRSRSKYSAGGPEYLLVVHNY